MEIESHDQHIFGAVPERGSAIQFKYGNLDIIRTQFVLKSTTCIEFLLKHVREDQRRQNYFMGIPSGSLTSKLMHY